MMLCSDCPNFTPWLIPSAIPGPSTIVAFKIDGNKESGRRWFTSFRHFELMPFAVIDLRASVEVWSYDVKTEGEFPMSSGSNPLDQCTLQAPQFTSTNVGMSTESALLNERRLRAFKFSALVLVVSCSNAMDMGLRFSFFSSLPQHRAETHYHFGSKIKYTFIQATLRWPDIFSPTLQSSSIRYLSTQIGYALFLFMVLLGKML